MGTPRISAIVPVRNEVANIRRTLEGLLSQKIDPAAFEVRIRENIAKMYRRDALHAGNKAVGAIIYILATKAMLALAVEFVYVSVFKQSLNYLALGMNVLFHPVLLFAATSGLSVPPEQNTKRIVTLIFDIVSSKQLPEVKVVLAKKGIFSKFKNFVSGDAPPKEEKK